jgi:hypothetical protein
VAYRSYLTLNTDVQIERLISLIQALQARAIEVTFHPGQAQLEFIVAEREERWITIGGLAKLLEDYTDVVCWNVPFEEFGNVISEKRKSIEI